MTSTSGSKRPLGPPSPPKPPPCRLRQEEQVDAGKPPSRKGKEVPADDDDPPEMSQEALRRRQDPPRVDEHSISRLNYLLLQDSDDHHESLPNLSEIVARIFQTEGWRLLGNLLQALRTNFESRQETALRVLPCLPEKQACEFFKDNYRSLYVRFLDLFESPNVNIQALTFDASSKLISLKTRLSLDGDIERLLLKMFVWVQLAFRNGSQIDILETRITDLVVFARHVDKSLHSVLTSMFDIVESADDNFITCRAIEIIMKLQQQKLYGVKLFVRELSKESKRRILEKCVRLMFRVEDVPSWYDMDDGSREDMGLLGSYEQGNFLLREVSSNSDEELLHPFGIEMIPQYLNSEDWKTRHAGVIAFSFIAKACAPDKICEQTKRVVDISLDDPHPRVRWAAIEVILSSISDDPKVRVQYLIEFLPGLVNIIRSTASIYPRVQLKATIAVRRLIKMCDNEGYVRSFSEDLVPELLKLLRQGVFRFNAMEILGSLAASFPVVFRSHYKETVDSLTPHVSQWMLGVKTIESLSYIFSWFLRDQSLFVLSDAEKVLTTVLKILDDWERLDNGVKMYILRALCELCKLPQNDELLNKTIPLLIQILKNTKDSTRTTLTVDKKQIPTVRMRIWACDLLLSFAVRFQDQFALWASRVSGLLTSLFKNTDDNDIGAAVVQVAFIDALPIVLLSCQHKKEYQELINSTVRALVQVYQKETEIGIATEMLKSLNACIAISGSLFNVDVIKQIALAINQRLSQGTIYWPFNLNHDVFEMEQQQEIIQAATECLETMINTLKSAFLPHVDELLPAVQALWRSVLCIGPKSRPFPGPSHDTWCPYKLKEVAISIFNLLLKDCPYKLQRYRDTFLQVVMDLCHSESLQLQREAARGIGLCATNTQLISNFDAPKAIDNLCHVIGCALESERRMTYDAAVSALGKICEFRHDNINGPQVVPIWINFLPLKDDFEEAKYAHQQLCRLLEAADPDILELHNKNLEMSITQILNKILLRSDYIATEETICSIISFLTQVGAMT